MIEIEYVEPIRCKTQINQIKFYLKNKNLRDYLLFVLGINSGLRISDLLLLTVADVKGKDRILLREKKTGKSKDFPLSDTCKKAIDEYLNTIQISDGCLFKSKKGNWPITRVQAYRIINSAAREIGINDAIGTHTLRKTFGYWAHKKGVDITKIQKLLNHSAPNVTLAYIGITKDELDDVYINLNL
ncbi:MULTISPECIES: site-specific integrase [Pelosinus]|uniref:Integrase family protein n=1 Tax=Pelosinus fermentans B4 TaxID=1149862 RepID=I9B5A9_9FIRM|nr:MULTISPECIES: site-specific integrase [Pelosinus]EIW20297.1 integrase family protein [Pelosinus fermentans B4]EIW25857.1 integrase family protein [Pelosinus fermentans A11]OAM93247.1 integrase family protein [Pelosinus fermentans DSM 17108]SDQ71593.1 Phage integrase family protein [Pelosinus fermentans]